MRILFISGKLVNSVKRTATKNITIARTVNHHVRKRCAEKDITLIDLVKLEVFDQVHF